MKKLDQSVSCSCPIDQSPRPFLKWAGSKHTLLDHLRPIVPADFGKYYEPFIGSGALLLSLQPKDALIGDLSNQLVEVWKAIRDSGDTIIAKLKDKTPDRSEFYEIRSAMPKDPIERASNFIYLNKSCFNGLYRVNSSGRFNVPFGSSTKTKIIEPQNIRSVQNYLRNNNVEIVCGDFAANTKSAVKGDFAFFDPPYVTKHNFNGFRDYNEKLFTWADQVRLANEARRLRSIGVRVMVSNAAHADIKELYSDFSMKEFERSSTLSSKSEHRGKVKEVIFYG